MTVVKNSAANDINVKEGGQYAGLRITASRSDVIYPKLDSGLDIEQAQTAGAGNGFGAVVSIQLAKNVVEVAFDRSHRDNELL
jgi:hypothetical protein